MNIICYISSRFCPRTKIEIEGKLHNLGINLDRLSGTQSKRSIYYIVEEDDGLYLYNDLPDVDLLLLYPIDGRIFKIPTEIIKYMVSISKSKSVKCFLINVAACKGDGGFDWEENPWMRWDDIITQGDYSSFYNSTTDKISYLSVDASKLCDCSSLIITDKITSISSETPSGTNGLYASPYKENIDTLYKTLTNINNKENENRLQEQGSTVLRGCRQQQGGVCGRRRKIAIRVKPISYKAVIGRG